jgi:hypothetical protein
MQLAICSSVYLYTATTQYEGAPAVPSVGYETRHVLLKSDKAGSDQLWRANVAESSHKLVV